MPPVVPQTRLKPVPLAFGLLSVVLYAIAAQLALPGHWQGMLLAIPLMLAVIGLGWRFGVLMVPLGVGVVMFLDAAGAALRPWPFYAGVSLVASLGVAAGQSLYVLWRATERGARLHARRSQLLSGAAQVLQQLTSPEELFAALPRLVADILDLSHAEVFVPSGQELELVAAYRWNAPPGFRLSRDSVCGKAFRTGEWQYVPDTRKHDSFIRAPGAPLSLSELAIPLHSGPLVVAVLNVEHERLARFDAEERRSLAAFTRITETALERIVAANALERRAGEQELLARLNHELLLADRAEEVARVALRELCTGLGLDAAAVFALSQGAFRPLATHGELPPGSAEELDAGLPWNRGWLHRSWRDQRQIYIADFRPSPGSTATYSILGLASAAFVPIVDAQGEPQAVLKAGRRTPGAFPPEERRLLGIAASALAVALERATLNRQLREMLEITRELAQSDDPRELFRSATKAAVRLIPGAEAASIMLLEDTGFRFVAGEGYDNAALERLEPLSEEVQAGWYQGTPEEYRSGKARLLRGDEVERADRRHGLPDQMRTLIERSGRVASIRANICVPVTYHGEVVAMLNLDNFTREDGFGVSSLPLAEAFAHQVGAIVRQALALEALERTAVTDALTGLGNREAFNRSVKAELARARRELHRLHLVMVDLDGFKRINDTLGHQHGDRALVLVADALRRVQRRGDGLFRWGGDEFALLLPATPLHEARAVAERYVEAIDDVRVDGFSLRASAGIASYPDDGQDSETLLRKADDLLYESKLARRERDRA